MKLIEAANAYMALQELSEREFDYETAHTFLVVKRELQMHAQFYADEEIKLAEEFAKRDGDGKIIYTSPGRFVLREDMNAVDYLTKKTALGDVFIEDLPVRVVSPPEKITAKQLEALLPVIDFGGGK